MKRLVPEVVDGKETGKYLTSDIRPIDWVNPLSALDSEAKVIQLLGFAVVLKLLG